MPRLNLPQKSSSQARSKARPADPNVVPWPLLPRLPATQGLRVDLLQLRIQRAAGDAELGARLHDANAGGANARVQPLRLGDQLVEHRVVEVAPPLVARRSCACAALRRPACAMRRRTSPAARAPRASGNPARASCRRSAACPRAPPDAPARAALPSGARGFSPPRSRWRRRPAVARPGWPRPSP